MRTAILISLFCLSFSAFAQLPSDAIAHYTMDGHGADASNNKNDGALTGAVTTTSDRFGNPCGALKFDGTTGYITVPSSPSLKKPISAYTVAAWVKMEMNPSSPTRKWLTICCKSNIADETFNSPQFRVQSMQDDAKGYNTVSMNTDFTEPAQENLLLGQWFFYVLRYDGQNVNAYIDGKNVFTFPYSKTFTANDMPLEIGRDVPGGMEFFCGTMDDLRIFDRALTLNEISALFLDVAGKGKTQQVTIQCPADYTKTALAGQCGIPVNYNQPTAIVDCGVANVKLISGLASEAFFPIGETTVTYQASSAQGSTAECSFVVRVQDSNLPTIACPKSIVTNTDPGMCSAVVQYPDATSPKICTAPTVQRVQGLPSGDDFPVGETKLVYRATDASAKTAECNFSVTVKDAEKPTIACPQDIHVQAPAGATGTTVTFPDPSFSDNCPNPKLTQAKGLASNAVFPIGTATLTFQAKDAAGNTAVCSFAVVVEQQSPELGLRCPPDVVVATDQGECSAIVSYPAATLTGNLPDAVVAQTSGERSGSKFHVGTQTVTFSAAHPSGKQSDCSFHITVKDKEKPVIQCPNDVHLQAKYESEGANFAFEEPPYADNCPRVTLTQTAGLASNSIFPVGSTTMSFLAKDVAGNTTNCSFTVDVSKKEPELPAKIDGDTVVFAKDMVTVQAREIRVYFYDNQDQDGDTISINYDGKWVVDHQKILGKKKTLEHNHYIDLEVTPGKVHYLVSKAWNEGKKPTNTLTIEIHDGVSLPRVLNLTSNIGKSSAIKIYYKK